MGRARQMDVLIGSGGMTDHLCIHELCASVNSPSHYMWEGTQDFNTLN